MISTQNSETNLERLRAQRWLYSSAKRALLVQFILDVPVIVVLGIASAFMRSPTLMGLLGSSPYDSSGILAILGIVVVLLDWMVLGQLVHSKRTTAARIQELFDCEVLKLPWNTAFVGRPPTREDAIHGASKHIESGGNGRVLLNWYPECVDELPEYGARLVCQRESLSWDAELRTRFVSHLIVVSLVVFAILFVIGMAGRFTLSNFIISVLAPCLPIFGFTLRQSIENRRSVNDLNDLRCRIDDAVNSFLKRELDSRSALSISRSIQDAIFVHRKSAPLIPDYYYEKYKQRDETLAIQTADQIVKEYKLTKSNCSAGGRSTSRV